MHTVADLKALFGLWIFFGQFLSIRAPVRVWDMVTFKAEVRQSRKNSKKNNDKYKKNMKFTNIITVLLIESYVAHGVTLKCRPREREILGIINITGYTKVDAWQKF